jgi:hypothetical protein
MSTDAEPCAKCGKDRPAELTEEERDAWNAYRAGYDDAIIPAHPVAIVKALKIYRAARAPLIEAHAREVAELQTRIAELEANCESNRKHLEFITSEYWAAVNRGNAWKEFVGLLMEYDAEETSRMSDDFVRASLAKRVDEMKATEMRGRVENTQSLINALGKARDSETRLAQLEQKRAELEKTRASIAKARAGADPRFLAFRLEPATGSTVTCAPWLWNMILAELDRCVMVIADLEEKIAGAEPAEKGPDEP